MDRNGALLSREYAACIQQVRAGIGRRLRKHYDADAGPMPGRLVDLVRQIERPNGPRKKGWPMNKPDEYRAHAQECERMAAMSHNPNEKAALLRLAQQWRSMIPKVATTRSDLSDQFDAGGLARTLTKSDDSH